MSEQKPISEEEYQDLLDQMPKGDLVGKLAEFFTVFGDSTRMQILTLLAKRSLNVTDIAKTLDMTISAVSHQLKILRQNDLVRTHREGKYVYYAISDDHVSTIINMGLEHILEDKHFES